MWHRSPQPQKCMVKDAPVMEYTIRRTAIEASTKPFQSLGYHPTKIEGGTSEWRRSSFHLHTHPWAKRGVKLSLHKDAWKKPAPIFTHKAENKGKDIEQELQRIQQKYKQITQAY